MVIDKIVGLLCMLVVSSVIGSSDVENTEEFESEIISVEEVELTELEKQLINSNPLNYVDPSIIDMQEEFINATPEEREEMIRKSNEAIQKQMEACEKQGEENARYIREVSLAGPLDF